MKIRIISASKVKQSFVLEGEAEYLKRLKGVVEIERVELSVPNISSLSEEEVMKKEADMFLSKIFRDEFIIVLDEHGKQFSSTQFSSLLQKYIDSGHTKICFIIGGAYGLDPRIKDKASLLLSLSSFTFPYQLSRLILIEQLYRAFSILKGLPYHK